MVEFESLERPTSSNIDIDFPTESILAVVCAAGVEI